MLLVVNSFQLPPTTRFLCYFYAFLYPRLTNFKRCLGIRWVPKEFWRFMESYSSRLQSGMALFRWSFDQISGLVLYLSHFRILKVDTEHEPFKMMLTDLFFFYLITFESSGSCPGRQAAENSAGVGRNKNYTCKCWFQTESIADVYLA